MLLHKEWDSVIQVYIDEINFVDESIENIDDVFNSSKVCWSRSKCREMQSAFSCPINFKVDSKSTEK
jgi:hypothetical protein